jgi:hypothetical protein
VGASGDVALAAEYALAFFMDLSSYWFRFGLESGHVLSHFQDVSGDFRISPVDLIAVLPGFIVIL